jgi:hypothetical protein
LKSGEVGKYGYGNVGGPGFLFVNDFPQQRLKCTIADCIVEVAIVSQAALGSISISPTSLTFQQ